MAEKNKTTDEGVASEVAPVSDEEILFARSLIKTNPPEEELTVVEIKHAIAFIANAYLVLCGRLLGIRALDRNHVINISKMHEIGKCIVLSDILEQKMTQLNIVALLRLVDVDLSVSFCTYCLEPDTKALELVQYRVAGRVPPHGAVLLPFRLLLQRQNDGLASGVVVTVFPMYCTKLGGGSNRIPSILPDQLARYGHYLEGEIVDASAQSRGYFLAPSYLEQKLDMPELASNY